MLNSWNPDSLNKAWDFATLAHHGQTYGGPTEGVRIDYINHIGSVLIETIWTIQNGCVKNPDLAIHCAILHDVVEDTSFTLEDIKTKFGIDVANGVEALTKNTQLPSKEEQMRDSLQRIKQQPHEVWIVKMADRITNLYHPPYYWKKEKIQSYLDESTLIYDELKKGNEVISKRLLGKIEEYKRFVM